MTTTFTTEQADKDNARIDQEAKEARQHVEDRRFAWVILSPMGDITANGIAKSFKEAQRALSNWFGEADCMDCDLQHNITVIRCTRVNGIVIN